MGGALGRLCGLPSSALVLTGAQCLQSQLLGTGAWHCPTGCATQAGPGEVLAVPRYQPHPQVPSSGREHVFPSKFLGLTLQPRLTHKGRLMPLVTRRSLDTGSCPQLHPGSYGHGGGREGAAESSSRLRRRKPTHQRGGEGGSGQPVSDTDLAPRGRGGGGGHLAGGWPAAGGGSWKT